MNNPNQNHNFNLPVIPMPHSNGTYYYQEPQSHYYQPQVTLSYSGHPSNGGYIYSAPYAPMYSFTGYTAPQMPATPTPPPPPPPQTAPPQPRPVPEPQPQQEQVPRHPAHLTHYPGENDQVMLNLISSQYIVWKPTARNVPILGRSASSGTSSPSPNAFESFDPTIRPPNSQSTSSEENNGENPKIKVEQLHKCVDKNNCESCDRVRKYLLAVDNWKDYDIFSAPFDFLPQKPDFKFANGKDTSDKDTEQDPAPSGPCVIRQAVRDNRQLIRQFGYDNGRAQENGWKNERVPSHFKTQLYPQMQFSSTPNIAYAMCSVCFDHGQALTECLNHSTFDETGLARCPILRRLCCPICGANGDWAHLIENCPNRFDNKQTNHKPFQPLFRRF